MDQGDGRADVRKVERLLNRGIATSDYGDRLVSIEESIAGGACRHALAFVGVLRIQTKVLRGSAGGNNQGITGVGSRISMKCERALIQIGSMNLVKKDLCTEPLSVCEHSGHQIRALQPMWVPRPVVYVGSRHQLTTLGNSGN